MTGELEGQLDGVEDPSQDDFSGGPRGVSFTHLFDRCRLLAMLGIAGVERAKYTIECVEENAFDMAEMVPCSLDHPNEVIDVYVPLLDDWKGTALGRSSVWYRIG
jgi:hypothetical protein